MPTVGKKKFDYDAAGEAKAEAYAKKTGQKMTIKKGAMKPKGKSKKPAMPMNPMMPRMPRGM